jgi:capsular polysaccharide biosynthesis protein
MMETRERPRPAPELDVEQEVDLGRYASAVAARWWLPLLGLLAGVIVGYALSLGGGEVYRAEALLYLGQPFSPSGSAPVQSLATNPRTVGEIVRSEAALRQAAAAADLPISKLRGRVSTQALTGTEARAGTTPLVEISVQGDSRIKVARAANTLANVVVENVSGYVAVKVETFQRQLAAYEDALESSARRLNLLNTTIQEADLEPLEELVLVSQIDNAEQRRGQLVDRQAQTQQQLALAQNVEGSRVVEPAVAARTTAQSRRNSILVAGAIGLLLGLMAALAWDAVAARLHGRSDWR